MRTEVTIVGRSDGSVRSTAVGGIAVRRTGRGVVHLIGTAATPLGGDTIAVRIVVERGARLCVHSVAATIALPGPRDPRSAATWSIEVGSGARLLLEPQPTIVAADAWHTTRTELDIHPDGAATVHELVQLGRARENSDETARAAWDGAMHVDVGGRPVLRHRVTLGAAPAAPPARALGSVFRYPDLRPASVSATVTAARLELVGGATLTTALADSADAARRRHDAIDLPTADAGRSRAGESGG